MNKITKSNALTYHKAADVYFFCVYWRAPVIEQTPKQTKIKPSNSVITSTPFRIQ